MNLYNIFKLLTASVIFLFTTSCKKNENLTPTYSHKLKVKEPSGLCLSFNAGELLTVSDETGKVYRISETGELLGKIKFLGVDLEGITINQTENVIYIIEEETNNIVKYNYRKQKIESEFSIPRANHKANSGLEGICYNPDNQKFYILNEKKPGKLFIWDEKNEVSYDYKLNFAADFSGICYDKTKDILWIVSDESQSLTACNLEGMKIASFGIPIKQAEGITLDKTGKKIFIISDKEEKLYVFDKPEI